MKMNDLHSILTTVLERLTTLQVTLYHYGVSITP